MPRRKRNIVHILFQKEYFVSCYYRTNVNVLRELILQKDAKFQQVWEKHTTSPICYEGCGYGNLPQKSYVLEKHVKQHKIEDALTAEVPLEHLPLEHEGWRSSFFALTKDSWFIRYGMMTGTKLEAIYLSHKHSFRTMLWNDDGYSIAMKSTHCVPSRNLSLPNNTDVIHAVIVFDVFPMKCQGFLEVKKSIFGQDATDAQVSLDSMVVCHSNDIVRIYSWEHILDQGRQFDLVIGKRQNGHEMGSLPHGLPVNILLEEAPPVLFQVKASRHNLVIGGLPFHYITCPPKCESRFQVYSLDTQTMAKNGDLQMPSTNMNIERDRCYFHADDSGRILHVGSDEIRMSRITEANDAPTTDSSDEVGNYEIIKEFGIRSEDLKQSTPPSRNKLDGLTVTMSGRVVKRRQSDFDDSLDCDYGCIQHVDYENEMDMIVLTAAYDVEAELTGFVYMINNYTGEIMKKIKLEEPWKEFHDHTMIIDLDTIVHITKGPMRKFSCYIHRLDRSLEDEDHVVERKTSFQQSPNFSRVAIRRGQRHRNANLD